MMRKSAKNVAQGKRNALPRQPFGELTCSESQVEVWRSHMADSRTSSVRKEIQDYLQCCENLLPAALMPNSPGLSEDEEGIVEYYAVELSKLNPRQRSKLEYRQSVLEYIRLSEVVLKIDNLSDQEHELMQQMLQQVVVKVLNPGPDGKP
jgi:hypothetical protein